MDLRSRSNDRAGCPGRGLFETPQSRQGWLAQIFIPRNASVQIEADDRAGLERLLRYCAHPPFALERLEAIDAQRLIYDLSKPQPNGHTKLMLTPLVLIDRLAALIPPPRGHRHRYHGVLAPNALLRAAVTALAQYASNGAQQQTGQEREDTEDAVEALWRSPARYL